MDSTHYKGNVVDALARDFKGFILGVFGNERNGVVGSATRYLFDECALIGIDDIDLTPLKEDVAER